MNANPGEGEEMDLKANRQKTKQSNHNIFLIKKKGKLAPFPTLHLKAFNRKCVIGRKRKWQPTLVSLPGEFYGQGSPVGYSPWGHKESGTTE